MTINRYATYGAYADGYSEDWAPSGAALFTGDGVSFAPSRMHGYPTFTLSWEQASVVSAGGDTRAYAPYVQELLIQLPWSGMSSVDRAALIAFHASPAINGMAGVFSLFNPVIGPALPVRFASDTLPAMPEIAFGRYRVELPLRVNINYPQSLAPGVPAAITGNRFVLGGVAMPFPAPLRPTTGYSIQKPQTLEHNSAGSPIIYGKSLLTLQEHQYSMALDFDGFINLLAFFFSFAHGARNRFAWIEEAGITRTLRLSGRQIIVRQINYNRYETDLNLVEEL